MSSNRFTNLSFNSLKDVGLLQLPFEQIDEMLKSQQGQFNMQQNLQQMLPKHIQESKYATEAVKQLGEYQKGIKNQLVEVAKTSNVRDYMSALTEANNKLANLYKPGGLAYNLEQDYKTYTEDIAAKQKALSEGKIKPWQYQTAVEDALNKYDTSQGTRNYSPIAKREAIDVNKLANDFVKNYEDNQYNKGELQIINGHVYHKNREISGVDAERVLQGLSAALKNAMFETGELEDLFKTQNKDNAIISDYRKSSLGEAQSIIDLLSKTNTKDEKEVTRLQQELNKYGANIEVDGKYGPQTQKAISMVRNSANEVISNISTVDDASLFEKAKNRYVDQYVQQLAAPYAQAKAHQKEEVKYTDMHETMGQWMAKEDYKTNKDKQLAKFKNDLENPFVPPTTGYTETVSNPFFSDIDEIKFKDGKPIAKNRLNEQIPQAQVLTGFGEKYGQYKKTYTTSEINDKELDIIDGIKERHKDLYGKDMTDAQLEKTYNALVQDRKSIKTMYNQYNDNKQKKNRTEVVLGDEKSLLNAGSRPMYVLSPTGVIEPKSVDQIIEMLGTDILGKGIEGEINPDNPFGTPTGDYATAVTKDGKQVAIVIGNRSIEEDSYMSTATQLAKAKYSLKPETIIVRDNQGRPTGAKLRSVPIIQTDENGEYQGVDAKIEMYDTNQNLIGTKPLSEYIQEKKSTNPYSNK